MRGCRPLNKEEIRAVLSQVKDQREKVLVLTSLYFGVRISEALKLKFTDFENNDYVRIQRSKNSNVTSLKIPQDFKDELKVLKDYYKNNGRPITDETPLFIGYKGHLSRQYATKLVKNLMNRSGLRGNLGFHSFRKSYITKIYELTGKDIVQTQAYSGHKNLNSLIAYIETTQYNDLTDELNY